MKDSSKVREVSTFLHSSGEAPPKSVKSSTYLNFLKIGVFYGDVEMEMYSLT